jgi:hypothetical protein
MAAGTLNQPTITTDGSPQQLSQSNTGDAAQGNGHRDVAPTGRQGADQKVRRRRNTSTTRRKTRAESDPLDRQGADSTEPAAIDHSGRFGTFPDPTAVSEALFCDNLGLARKVAWKWTQSTGLGYDDIEAVAMRGLLRGCRKYDPERINPASGRPYALSTAVIPFVHGELLHEFRDKPYAVRFPARWREKYGMVMRLLDQHADYQQIAAETGLDAREVEELVEAMVRPGELHDELHGSNATEAELDLLSPLAELLELAWDGLSTADQGLIGKWWEAPARKVPFPSGALQQLDKRLARLLGGRRLPQLRQLQLCTVPEVAVARKRRERRQKSAALGVVQMALLG